MEPTRIPTPQVLRGDRRWYTVALALELALWPRTSASAIMLMQDTEKVED